MVNGSHVSLIYSREVEMEFNLGPSDLFFALSFILSVFLFVCLFSFKLMFFGLFLGHISMTYVPIDEVN